MTNRGEIIRKDCLGDEDIALVNRYTKREMTARELYCFSMILCDNEIDRDFEQFPTPELYKIARLFEGKTGIFDHAPSAANQCARIYRCVVCEAEGKKNSLGETYAFVKADAYIPKNDSTSALIDSIESGIRKEISIGCAVKRTVCSICGGDMNGFDCVHKKGQSYDGSLCFGKLSDVSDAYEWSFVAVPAQRSAGVIKKFDTEVDLLDSLSKKLKSAGNITLSDGEKAELVGYIERLKQLSSEGESYRRELIGDILKLNAFEENGVEPKILSSVAERMTISELKAFKAAFERKSASPQLGGDKEQSVGRVCDDYII